MMADTFQQLLQFAPFPTLAELVLRFVIFIVADLLPSFGAIYLIYFLLTLPMRRNERARLFLDLVQLGLKEGRTPEGAIVEAASSRDRSLGVRFHLLAAYLEAGMPLSEALKKVPRLLPPQIRAILKTGERIGDISKVLAACRQVLTDGVSHVRGALNYLVLLVFLATPAIVVVPIILKIKVLPSFKQVFQGMAEGKELPAFTRLVFAQSNFSTCLQIALLCFIWLAMLMYVGGPRLHEWLRRAWPSAPDWILARLPWRRKRLQRDFSAMLAVLLDCEVPEAEAVRLAAESTSNLELSRRADKVCARLKEGVKLPEAIRALDGSGELQWRLSNGLHRGSGFLRALSGWHEALDAKAFQLEQSAAQIATTALVLLNGLIVGSLVVAIFLVLIQLLNEAVLW